MIHTTTPDSARRESYAKRRMRHRRPIPIIAAATVLLVLIAGCKGTTVTGGGTVVVTWDTATPLTGTLPVGRWACIDGNPGFDRLATSNRHRSPEACKVAGAFALELRADGTGHTLLKHRRPATQDDVHDGVSAKSPPDDAFGLAGSDLLYSRDDALRWTLDEDELNIQTTRDHGFRVERITPNVMLLCSTRLCSVPRYLIRIGSPEYARMLAFRRCVDANKGRPLFEVQECPLPFALTGGS